MHHTLEVDFFAVPVPCPGRHTVGHNRPLISFSDKDMGGLKDADMGFDTGYLGLFPVISERLLQDEHISQDCNMWVKIFKFSTLTTST
jgi:hypothetical protein